MMRACLQSAYKPAVCCSFGLYGTPGVRPPVAIRPLMLMVDFNRAGSHHFCRPTRCRRSSLLWDHWSDASHAGWDPKIGL